MYTNCRRVICVQFTQNFKKNEISQPLDKINQKSGILSGEAGVRV